MAPHGPASVQGTGNPGRERKGSWEKSLDPRGKAGWGGWPKKWLGTFRQTGCREEAEAEGKVGRAGQVGRGSSEEHRSCVQVDGDRGPRLPCTLQVPAQAQSWSPALPVTGKAQPISYITLNKLFNL